MKITLLLVALTLLVIVLPLLPALQEWRRPSDVTPLPIDEADALEPDYMARRFGARLDDAIERGLIELGGVPLVHLPTWRRTACPSWSRWRMNCACLHACSTVAWPSKG